MPAASSTSPNRAPSNRSPSEDATKPKRTTEPAATKRQPKTPRGSSEKSKALKPAKTPTRKIAKKLEKKVTKKASKTAPKKPAASARNRLIIREGARFACGADGLCCTSIHALGPVGGKELVDVRRLSRRAVTYESHFRAYMMTLKEGRCIFLMDNDLCKVHAKYGMDAKPATCRKFPFALTSTPDGRRVVTSHRCPCRTMGERAEMTPESVDKEIRVPGVPLRSERAVDEKIKVAPGKKVSWDKWRKLEEKLFKRLAAGENPSKVLGFKTFGRLKNCDWEDLAEELREDLDESYFDVARLWVADAIMKCTDNEPMTDLPRPWAKHFDKAESRATVVRKPRDIINDWLADEIWAFEWADEMNFKRAQMDWANKIALIDAIRRYMKKHGTRSDRATAEAIMIVDAVCTSEYWEEAQKGLIIK